jgi:hypothetical protein
MSNLTLEIEIPAGASQSDMWQVEGELKSVEGFDKISLYEPKDLLQSCKLFLEATIQAAGIVTGGFTLAETIKEAAEMLHIFLHPPAKKSEKEIAVRKKVTLNLANGTKVELYGYSAAELADVLSNPEKYAK